MYLVYIGRLNLLENTSLTYQVYVSLTYQVSHRHKRGIRCAHHNCDENLGGKIIIHARTHLRVHEFSGIQNARRLSRGGDKKLLTITDDLKTICDLTAKPKIVPHSCRLFFP